MTLPDKMAEAGKQQLASHIDFFQSLTSRMFENAERILALNLQTTRTTLDQTTGAVRQLAAARDPRDLLALRAQSQQQVEAVMAYSRKLLEITNKPVVAEAPTPAAAPASAAEPAVEPAAGQHIDTAPPVVVNVPAEEPTPAIVEEAAAPEAAAAQPDAAPVPSAILPSEHPLGEADPTPPPAIKARARPIAKAASEVAAAPVDVPHPASSPMPEAGPIVIPPIAPVEAAPPHAEASAPPVPKRAGKGGKKR
jgi:phasin family protein